MATRRRASSNAVTDRLGAFLSTQQRIVADFQRSLGNARHFIELAAMALEREPENTELLLAQVMEIDLLRHVSEQFETFQSVAAMLSAAQGPLEPDAGALREVRHAYEALIRDAEEQADRIANLLSTLRVKH